MPWYGWLSIGVLATTVIGLVIYLLLRKPQTVVGLTPEEKDKLLVINKEREEQLLKIEQDKNAKLQQLAVKLQTALEQIQGEYDKVKEHIDEERRTEIEQLRKDTDAAGRELDLLLGIRRRDDPTSPGRPPG